MTSLPSRCGLSGLAGARGAAGGDDDDVGGVDQAGGDGRGERQGGDGRVAAGDGDPAGAREHGALVAELGQAVGPGAGVLAAVELLPRVGVGEPEVGAAVDHHGVVAQLGGEGGGLPVRQGEEDDVVAGEASAASVSPSTRSASGSRCGWSAPSVAPALEPAVRAPISTSGWDSSSRSSSPPAYPLAPATATRDRHVHDYTETWNFMSSRVPTPFAPRPSMGWHAARTGDRVAGMTPRLPLPPPPRVRPLPRRARRGRPLGARAVVPRVGRRRPALAPRRGAVVLGARSSRSGGRAPRASSTRRGPTDRDALLTFAAQQADRLVRVLTRDAARDAEVYMWADGQDGRLHPAPPGPRGAHPPSRRRAGRR